MIERRFVEHRFCSLCVSVCMLTVSNDFLMSSATVMNVMVVCFG